MIAITIAAIGLIIVSAIAQAYLPRQALDRLTTVLGSIGAAATSTAIIDVPGIDKKILAIVGGLCLTAWAALTNKEPRNIYPTR